MKVKVRTVKLAKVEAEASGIFVTAEGWENQLAEVDKMLGGKLVGHLKFEHFTAKAGETHAFPVSDSPSPSTIIIVSLGTAADINLSQLRQMAAKIANFCRQHKRTSLALDLTSDWGLKDTPHEVAKVVVEGVVLGSYRYTKYKSDAKDTPELAEVTLISTAAKLQHVVNGAAEGELAAAGTFFARDLINESPTVTTPTYLANVAKKLARRGEVTVEIFEKKDIEKLGMGAYLAVNQGATEPPKFIKLTYKGGKKKIVVCGKAITFDTGGLSLKDAKNMETMKLDMAGAAAVLGLFSILPQFKPKATVVGLIAATENMPGPTAMKPGDIVTALNGKTIEILNTDAEGRLTLADALAYAAGEKPEAIVDLATLTGACMVALGEEIAGLFSNNRNLADQIKAASQRAGEKVWELPLEKAYHESIKSEIADLRNIGKTRYGGAVTAALFLEEFVGKIPWLHLDIAGPAFEERGMPLVPKGGAGFGVRTLLNYLKNL